MNDPGWPGRTWPRARFRGRSRLGSACPAVVDVVRAAECQFGAPRHGAVEQPPFTVGTNGTLKRTLRMTASASLIIAVEYADDMRATAIVQGKVVRFELSPALARAHRKNRDGTMTETEAIAFVEAKQRASAKRRARARRSSSQ